MTTRRFLAIFLVIGALVGLVGRSPLTAALVVAFGLFSILIDRLVDAIHPEPAATQIRGERWIRILLVAAAIALIAINGFRLAYLGFAALGLLDGMYFSRKSRRSGPPAQDAEL